MDLLFDYTLVSAIMNLFSSSKLLRELQHVGYYKLSIMIFLHSLLFLMRINGAGWAKYMYFHPCNFLSSERESKWCNAETFELTCVLIFLQTIFWSRIWYECLKKLPMIVNVTESNIYLYSKNLYKYLLW